MTIPLLHARNVNQELYVRALSSAYRTGWRVYDPDFALSREPDVYEKVRRDPVIAHAIDVRLHNIAGKTWYLKPYSDEDVDIKIAEVITEMIKDMDKFEEARYELAQAVIRGRSWAYIEAERRFKRLSDLPPQNWIMPTRLKDIDRRRFRVFSDRSMKLHRVDATNAIEQKLDVFWQLFSVERDRWETIENPEYFVRLIYQDEEARLGYGRGLLEAIYFYHYAKGVLFKEGLQGIERWAQGIPIAKIEGLREASTGKTNDTIQQAWLDALNLMKESGSFVYDNKDELTFESAGGPGNDMVMDMIRYLDEAMVALIAGGNLHVGGSEGGSLARAETQEDTAEMIVQYDRNLNDESLTVGLIELLFHLNQPQFRAAGLGEGRRPKFTTIQQKREDPEKNAGIMSTVLATGAPIIKKEFYEKVGLTPPTAKDEVIVGQVEKAEADPTSKDLLGLS